ncbi:formiminoglutamase [Arthrobacter alpinus]|uniref:Formimidoylglutamase n=1 Tax=Arthrobacter alpinus TaxID=656366 RepID=A0A1H5L9Y0_9MICC|nr:formimidoylglutamase [Arthrobacter alpinus]SEE73879.1 formiminoglutamase [Arthrobacter alpinus]
MTPDLSPTRWAGRDDGPGPEHRRWHHAVNDSLATAAKTAPGQKAAHAPSSATSRGIALMGFRSDEGVRRNRGRTGAAEAPAAIRAALTSLSAPKALVVRDLGDVTVVGDELEEGQERLGREISDALQAGNLPVVLGGGHETAFGSYLGLAASGALAGQRLGIINLDAHFDLRADSIPSSGTPFRQIAELEAAAGRPFTYRVVGISEANNTLDLFQTAARLGVEHLLDEDCSASALPAVKDFVDRFLDGVDAVYLTIDLDVLPAHTAPGVSAPAALGVPMEVILAVCRQLSASSKLVHVDVVELNPRFDIDNRTARAAARLVHAIASEYTALPRETPADPASLLKLGIELP